MVDSSRDVLFILNLTKMILDIIGFYVLVTRVRSREFSRFAGAFIFLIMLVCQIATAWTVLMVNGDRTIVW